ncbi:MAG: hypothetical protein IJN90_03145 [Bacilli bacterium]|nr:hypothetical protein [Bacilli bacterium]
MIDINDYKQIYNKKIKSVTKIWVLFIIFIIIGIIYINNSFKYIRYYSNLGEYKKDNLYIYVLIDDLNKITKNNKVLIENKEFAYKIKEISEENININNNYYKEVKLDIKDNKFINNEVINITIKIEELDLIKYIYKTIWR